MDDNRASFVVLVLAAAEELNPSLEEPVDVAWVRRRRSTATTGRSTRWPWSR